MLDRFYLCLKCGFYNSLHCSSLPHPQSRRLSLYLPHKVLEKYSHLFRVKGRALHSVLLTCLQGLLCRSLLSEYVQNDKG